MAQFNITPESQPTGSYTGMSQGVYADRNDALGRLFGTLADTMSAGVQAADEAVITQIEEDVFNEVELARQEFGGPYATTIQEDVDTGRASRLPEHIAQSLENLEGLQASYAAGGLRESHYWARMNAVVRQLRGRYPGYRQEIDAAVSSLLGTTPANALQSALFSEWRAATSNSETDRLEKLEDSATANGTMPPDYWQRAQNGTPYSFIELQQYVSMRNRIDADTSTRRANLAERADNNALNERQALIDYEAELQNLVSLTLYDSSKAIGQDWNQFQERLAEATQATLRGESWSQEEIEQLRVTGNILRNQIELEAERLANAAHWGDSSHSYSQYISGADRNAALQRALAPVDLMLNRIAAGDVTMANIIVTQNEAKLTDAGARLLGQYDFVADLSAISDMMGPEAAAIYYDAVPGLQDAVSSAFAQGEATKAALPNRGNIRIALQTIADDPNLDPQTGIALVDRWATVMDMWDKGQVTDDIIRNNIQYMFTEDALSIFDTLATREDQYEYYRRVASPRVTDIMINLKNQGDIESWELYREWVWNGFQALFRDSVQNLNSVLEQGMDIQWDANTNGFRVLGLQGGDITGTMSSPQWRMLHLGHTAPQDVTLLNSALRNIAPIIQEDNGDVAREVILLLQRAGFNPATPVDRRTPVHKMWDSLMAWIGAGEEPELTPVPREMTGGGF